MFYLASGVGPRSAMPLSDRGCLLAVTAAVAIGMTLVANNAIADVITYALTTSNQPAPAGPLGQLTIDLTSPTTAIVTVHPLDEGSFAGGVGTVGVNVNGSVSVDGSDGSNAATSLNNAPLGDERGRHPSPSGSFNLWLNGLAHSSTGMSVNLTAVGGNSWNSAAQVLVPNGKGKVAAIHLLACPTGDSACVERHHGHGVAAFAGSTASDPSPTLSTPVPAAAWLFGSGLLGLIAIARRRVKTSDPASLPVGNRAAAA